MQLYWQCSNWLMLPVAFFFDWVIVIIIMSFHASKGLDVTDYASSSLPAAGLLVIWRDALTFVHVSLIIFISPKSWMLSLASVFNIIVTSAFSFLTTVSFTNCQSLAGIHPEKIRYTSRKKIPDFYFSHTQLGAMPSQTMQKKKKKRKQPRDIVDRMQSRANFGLGSWLFFRPWLQCWKLMLGANLNRYRVIKCSVLSHVHHSITRLSQMDIIKCEIQPESLFVVFFCWLLARCSRSFFMIIIGGHVAYKFNLSVSFQVVWSIIFMGMFLF